MSFTASEVRERHAYIDRSLENTVDVLRAPEAIELLGGMATSRAVFIENSYVVPNIRHGEVKLNNVSQNQVPIIAINADEPVKIGPQFRQQTVNQKKAMRQMLTGDTDSSAADKLISQLTPSIGDGSVRIGTANAMVASLSDTFNLPTKNGESLPYHVHARPMMVLKYRDDAYRVNPSTIVHETEHVIQVQRKPMYEAPVDGDWSDIRLREELEAYRIQALTLKAMQGMGYVPSREYMPIREVTATGEYVSDIITIDRIRQRMNANREDKFYPSQELKDRLAKMGLANFYQSKTGGAIS